MLIFKKSADLSNFLTQIRSSGKSIGFVPTMGALHEGHISLLKKCKQDSDISVCSIFINPSQFTNISDLNKYPRTEARDIILLEKHQCDILFLPDVQEIYKDEPILSFNLKGLDKLLEGKSRPGHFEGVARVVKLFFEIIKPDTAFFGLKDYQQCLVINNMVDQFGFNVELVFVETRRENNGLAMSSRNMRLDDKEREMAGVIYKALQMAREGADKDSISRICSKCIGLIESQPGFIVDYFEIVDPGTLQPKKNWEGNALAITAVFVGEVRLIDNLIVKN